MPLIVGVQIHERLAHGGGQRTDTIPGMVRLTLGARIEQAGRALVDAASSPARVILFGSHARGDADDGSDFDFLDAALAERRAKVPGTMVHRALLEGRVVAES